VYLLEEFEIIIIINKSFTLSFYQFKDVAKWQSSIRKFKPNLATNKIMLETFKHPFVVLAIHENHT
jgi:hypothetical protein